MQTKRTREDKDLLKPWEVAQLFRVDPKTVGRWALAGRVGSLKTPGGHRRFHRKEIEELLLNSFTPAMAVDKIAEMEQLIADRRP